MPGDDSTPDETSMPNGCTRAMASATLSGVSPPASTMRRSRASAAAIVQSTTWPVPPRLTGSCASTSSITCSGHIASRSR